MKLSKELLAVADLHAESSKFSEPVKEGLGKQIARVVTGATAGARAKQEKEKSFNALRAGDTKAAEKHMQRHLSFEKSADDKRLEKLIKAAMNKGDDYTAKSYAKMAETSDGRKYLNSVIKQMMKPLKESAENTKADELEVGDRVVITGKVMHQGDEGEIVEFGKDKKLVTVKLDNDNKTRSFHSTDVTDLKAKYEDDDEEDDFEDQPDEDVFYVAVVSMDDSDEEDGFVGKVAIIDGKWRELPAVGKPHYKWGQKYMGYLSQADVMQYIKKDFGRYYYVKGPFNTLKDAKDEAEDSGLELDESVQNMLSSFMNKAFNRPKVDEAITYTNIEDWKKAVKNSYPQQASKMRFNGRMEGGKMTVSAEVPGIDRCFGVWDQEDEKGEVLSEAAKFRKGELVVDSTGKEFKVVSVDKNWDLLTVSSGGRTFIIDQNKVTKVNTKLTPKEQEIKELLANGTSPEEVADIMQMPVSKVTKFMESSNLERKQKRIGLMIDDYIKRSKATTNDIKKSHYLDMAKQLRDQLADLKLTEADEPSEDEKENGQIIAKADEYRVILYKDTETVDLLDGEETILVSMPLVIWKQLTRQ